MAVATTRRRKGATRWTTEATDGKRRSGLLVETGSLAMPSPAPVRVNVTAELDRYVLLNITDGSACPFGRPIPAAPGPEQQPLVRLDRRRTLVAGHARAFTPTCSAVPCDKLVELRINLRSNLFAVRDSRRALHTPTPPSPVTAPGSSSRPERARSTNPARLWRQETLRGRPSR
jgi:hypothetical protein